MISGMLKDMHGVYESVTSFYIKGFIIQRGNWNQSPNQDCRTIGYVSAIHVGHPGQVPGDNFGMVQSQVL